MSQGQKTARSGAGGRIASPYQDRAFRGPRNRDLMRAVARIDTEMSETSRAELVAWITGAYEEQVEAIPLGFFSRCYLGPPYVDHRLGLTHMIIEHFRSPDPVPEPFAAARVLARSPAYAFIEVYHDGTLVPVREDGSVVPP
ncbi:hypothetical protein [Nocardiopsis valliformis]|uniref:hypothetical protein n=1 Tax=Nocardiopsis valliformis TaxID=239974 RepID=UPI001955377B|nr:hypothetical protein [Nocardiopsis valliformis]